MILLDKPFVSDFLLETIRKNNFKVIETEGLNKINPQPKLNTISTDQAIEEVRINPDSLFYTNSENSIEWVEKNLSFNGLPEKIKLFKNKIAFRDLIKEHYPDYYYQGINIEQLDSVDINNIPIPFVIKPAVGFLSLGVHKVDLKEEWDDVRRIIQKEVSEVKELFPTQVLNTNMFIIEECIVGDEFAIDCYFDSTGKPVILNILKHIFGSEKDVSDRVYITSKEIIESYKPKFKAFLNIIGEKAKLKNFPCHVEVRVNEKDQINPIEVNPMRFGGLCTTADLTWHAYGFNSYEYFFNQMKPDWDSIFKLKSDCIFSLVLLDNSTGVDGKEIASFDFDKVLEQFENPLEFRKFDFTEYPLFGYLFCETKKENQQELNSILKSDLKEFITLK